jgi:hypothetical protein
MNFVKSVRVLLFLFVAAALVPQYGRSQPAAKSASIHSTSLTASDSGSRKFFAHTDKLQYAAGEVVWFKIYQLRRDSMAVRHDTAVVYCQLVDRTGRVVVQAVQKLVRGAASGSWMLPFNLSTGAYDLRVYTQDQNSNGPVFEKTLTIVSPVQEREAVAAGRKSYFMSFFPEGGDWIAGIETVIGFKITDEKGRAADMQGTIVRNGRDTIGAFSTHKFGLGRFRLTATSSDVFAAVIQLPDGSQQSFQLPAVANAGYSMRVTRAGPGARVTVMSNRRLLTGLHLVVRNGGRQIFSAPLTGNDDSSFAQIPESALAEGTSAITVLTSANEPAGERLVFRKPSTLHTWTVRTADKFSTRQAVDLDLNFANFSGKALKADASVSVYLADKSADQTSNIAFYNYLQCELKGQVESPDYYFTGSGPEYDEAVENLLLTHGWRRFEKQASKVSFADRTKVEQGTQVVRVKVTNSTNGVVGAGIMCYLSVPSRRLQFYTSVTDEQGIADFYVKNLYGRNELIIQTDPRKDSVYKFELLDPLPLQNDGDTSKRKFSSEASFTIADAYRRTAQIQNNFLADKINQGILEPIDSTPFFLRPVKTYLTDEFTRFQTMEEVLREYVVEVVVRRREAQLQLEIVNALRKEFLPNPLLMIDGVPVFGSDKILRYDPLKIQKIDVVDTRYFYGPSLFPGIVNFTSYEGNLPDFELNPFALVVDHNGIEYQRQFYHPQYETADQLNSRVPDFRNVLTWEPNLATNDDGKAKLRFYTSDQPGTYRVDVQGIAADGSVGSGTAWFVVEKRSF